MNKTGFNFHQRWLISQSHNGLSAVVIVWMVSKLTNINAVFVAFFMVNRKICFHFQAINYIPTLCDTNILERPFDPEYFGTILNL